MAKKEIVESYDRMVQYDIFQTEGAYSPYVTTRRTKESALESARQLYRAWVEKNKIKVSNGRKPAPFNLKILKTDSRYNTITQIPFYIEPIKPKKAFDEVDPDWNPAWDEWV